MKHSQAPTPGFDVLDLWPRRAAFADQNPYEKGKNDGGDNTNESPFYEILGMKIGGHSRNSGAASLYIFLSREGG
jgi:hypothetical protein